MIARLRRLWSDLRNAFWMIPALLVFIGIALALGCVALERSESLPTLWRDGDWLYDGGGTGARTLLGAVASSTIGVAGTVFSITIAALSLAAGQMGPRLLRNFVRDRGNQITLGIYLGTFSYALMVLRSIRTREEGDFVPHLAMTVAVLLALLCVATLVYYVGHMAGRINVDTVIELVSVEMRETIARLSVDRAEAEAPAAEMWRSAALVTDPRHGYLQELDEEGLADWCLEHKAAIQLLVRPGDYVFPGAPIALVTKQATGGEPLPVKGADAAIHDATALGPVRRSSVDLEYPVRQLVEVAIRALSAGINDPHTARSVLDRLGAALCQLAPLHLRTGVFVREGSVVLVVPPVTYEGLTNVMFHMIRQNGAMHVTVLMRLLEVLSAVASCERDPQRRGSLRRHADLVLGDAERTIQTPSDLADIRSRHARFTIVFEGASARQR